MRAVRKIGPMFAPIIRAMGPKPREAPTSWGQKVGQQRTVNYTLKPATINAAKPKGVSYELADGGGLYLEVLPGGSKVWRYRYRLGDRRPKATIGPYPQFSIADARTEHERMRALVAKGIDPIDDRREAEQEVEDARRRNVRFGDYTLTWINETMIHRSAGYRAQNIAFLDAHINPVIGRKLLADVKAEDVLKIMRKLQATAVTADRCRTIIQQVYKHAARNLIAVSNPAVAVRGAITIPPKKHHRHLNERELGAFWRELLKMRTATIITAYASRLLMLTLLRKGELRLAKWPEIDLDAAVWDVPAERMKMRKPHRVYLSRQAVDLLRMLHQISGHGEYVFPTRYVDGHGRPIGDVTLNHLFKRLDFGVPEFSPHGVRGTGSTLLREAGVPRDVVESMLAHQIDDAVEAAYNHAEFATQKRQAWQLLADRIDQLAAS